MTRRHDALIPLTHDHHHALVQARALIAAAGTGDEERKRAGEAFIRFYEDDTLLHFHEEEEVLFPRLLEHVSEPPSELVQVLVEHVRIHGYVDRLRTSLSGGAPAGEQLKVLGETLKAHVRLEETKLFPLIERTVPADALESVEFAERDRSGTSVE